jgi:mannosylglycerate hydrolase
VETDFYSISVNPNGTLNIFDKKLNQSFENVLLLENGGDDGDEYDFSPLPNEELLYSNNVAAKTEIRQNRYGATIDIRYTLDIPGDLEQRKAKVADSGVGVHIAVTIAQEKQLIHVELEVDNHARDHRLRALIPTGIASSFSISDHQFGSIKRNVIDSAIEVWEEENWDERPDPIYPMLSYAGLSNDNYGVSVLTNSTREYEIIGKDFDTIAITLFRSIGFLGKEEMLRRPGRPSGIKLPTPDSQMIGKMILEFAIATSDQPEKVARTAKEYLTPVVTYNKIPHDAMKLNRANVKTPLEFSFFKEVEANVVLSTLKKAERDAQFVLRFFNPTEAEATAVFEFNRGIAHTFTANLNEKAIGELELTDNQVQMNVKTNQVKSILF